MVKKTYTYTDYNGTERKEDFYFNITEAELIDMEMGTEGGVATMLQRIVDAQDAPALIKAFKDFILFAYGEKSPDGRRFDKSEEISRNFSHTIPFSMMYMEFATDDKAASNFVNALIPKALQEKMQKRFAESKQ